MTLYHGADGAYPGAPLPAGTSILAAYVGEQQDPGPPDTPHIWTTGEWNSYLEADPHLRVLPIYTHSYPGDPVADADNAADAVLELGWKPGIGRLIAIDLETLVDPPYVSALGARLEARGFHGMPYGSAYYVMQNPPLAGRWVAQLTSYRPAAIPPGAVGVQWRFGQHWDSNVFSEFVYANCGVGLRHPAS